MRMLRESARTGLTPELRQLKSLGGLLKCRYGRLKCLVWFDRSSLGSRSNCRATHQQLSTVSAPQAGTDVGHGAARGRGERVGGVQWGAGGEKGGREGERKRGRGAGQEGERVGKGV
eukprot:158372-Rhodomonas_salina.2